MDLINAAQRYINLWSSRYEIPKWLPGLVNQWLPHLVILLLVILVGRHTAHLTWRLIPEPARPPIAVPQTGGLTMSSEERRSPSEVARRIADLHLFGQAGAAPREAVKGLDTKAPETNLKLTLHGVFAGDEAEDGAAIIGKAGSTQDYYKVGSDIMSGVKLQAVFHDRVVLTRDGQTEVLRFPKTTQPMIDTREKIASNAAPNPLSEFRDQFKQEPLKIFQHVRFVPVRSGKSLKGYRVLPQKDRELYNQLGIRPSDLVTAVNGIRLNNDQEAIRLIDQLKDASQLNVEILRRGQPQSLNISLN